MACLPRAEFAAQLTRFPVEFRQRLEAARLRAGIVDEVTGRKGETQQCPNEGLDGRELETQKMTTVELIRELTINIRLLTQTLEKSKCLDEAARDSCWTLLDDSMEKLKRAAQDMNVDISDEANRVYLIERVRRHTQVRSTARVVGSGA